MRKICSLICAGLAIAILFCGCQQTPDKPVVVQKDMEQMIEKAQATAGTQTPEASPTATAGISYADLCAYYGVPERFELTITEDNLTVSCDVAVELPETMKLPMARVMAGRFSQERVSALFHALCAGTQMYVSPELMDKAYYEQEIVECQARLAQATEENDKKIYKDIIDGLKEQYEKAPETLTLIPCDGTLKSYEFDEETGGGLAGTQQRLFATSDPHNMENPMTLSFQNDSDYTKTTVYSFEDEYGNTQIVAPRSGSDMEFSREGEDTWFGLYDNGTRLEDVTALSLTDGKSQSALLATTPRQARDVVERFLAETGIDDMVIGDVGLYTSKRELPAYFTEYLEQQGREVSEPEPETHAYVFRLLRAVNGVKVESCEESSETSTDGMSFGKEWYYEELNIAVDDNGIANVYWMAPLEVTEVLTDHAAVLPFSDIADIFKKMVVISNIDRYINPGSRQRMDITHVSLSLQRIMEQDSITTGLLVPVWNFYGTMTNWGSDGEERTTEWEHMPILSVNAIDGSIIDVFKGY